MALLAILLLFTIFKYIDLSATRQQMSFPNNGNAKSKSGTNWGDVFDSVKYKITMAVMAGVTGTENFHAKNWRPQLLTLVDTDEEGTPLAQEVLALAAQFRGGRGLNIVVSIKHGSYLRKGTFEISQRCSEKLKKFMEKERLQVSKFSYVYICQSINHQPSTHLMSHLPTYYSIGILRSDINTLQF